MVLSVEEGLLGVESTSGMCHVSLPHHLSAHWHLLQKRVWGWKSLRSSFSDSNMATMGERPLSVKDDALGIAGFTHCALGARGL